MKRLGGTLVAVLAQALTPLQAAPASSATPSAPQAQRPVAAPAPAASPRARPHPDRFDACFIAAGHRYGVSPLLLKAIARQESGLNPTASHRNRNGSTDIGLMQINSSWLPTLARHGVQARDLQAPCVNVFVGAWILASNFQAMGRNANALGAYNARDPAKREAYARQVLRHYTALGGELSPPPTLPRPSTARPSARS